MYLGAGNEELNKEEELKDARPLPMKKIWPIFVAYFFLILINFLKGTDKFPSILNIKQCSSMYWILYFSFFFIALILTLIAIYMVHKEYQYRLSINFNYNRYDVKWNKSLFIKFPLYSFLAGTMAGMLGIGGGLILGPLLLELGLHPIVLTE